MAETHLPMDIFIIEDDPDTCGNLCDILELDGYGISWAYTAAEALSHPDLARASVILLDRKLPDTRADELLPELQTIALESEIMIVTGHADLDNAIFAMRLGASDYLLKPIDPDSLRMSLKRIAKRRETEAQLRQERDFAQTVIETAQAIVLVLDRAGRVVRFNPFMENLTGYRLDEVQEKDWFETFLPESDCSRIRTLFERSLEGEPVRGHINPIVTREGRERAIAWWATTLKNSDGLTMGILSIGHDVTELQEAQRRALQAERLAAIGKAMAGLAHESRNALQRSQVNLEMLARRLEGRDELLELTTRIQRAQDDLHQLYEEVREYAAPIRLNRQPTDLTRLLLEVWSDLKFKREGRDATLRQHCGPIELTLAVDWFGIKQVFRNILENSLAACSDPVQIDVHFSETSLGDQPALRMAFRDNGPGLTSEAKERIFEEFYTTKTHGTGVGMAICKRVVEAHDGRILPGSGPGAEILITIPYWTESGPDDQAASNRRRG